MKRHLLVFLLYLGFLLPSIPGSAQTPFLRSHQLFRGKEDYMVNVIYQDPKGWIWFGTDKGLFRFDGISYSRFTTSEGLADNHITALSSSHSGMLWVGHRNGEITHYDGHSFQVFNPEEGMGKVTVSDIVFDSAGVAWFSTLGEGVYRYDGRYLTNLDTDNGISDNNVYDIEADKTGILWFATDYGITRYTSDSIQLLSMKDGLPDNIVRVIKSSGDGRLWLGTEELGLVLYHTTKNSFQLIEGWDFGAITGFTMSLENDIWISTQRQGIIQLRLRDTKAPVYKKISEAQGLISNRIHTIVKDLEENIWIGGKQGVIQALPPVFEFLNKSNGTPFSMVYSLVKLSTGDLWVCSEVGLFRGIQDPGGQYSWSNISERISNPETNFISLYSDPDGWIWAGTYGEGVFRIDPKSLNARKYCKINGLGDDNVISISGFGDKIWFSTLGGGVTAYDRSKMTLHHYREPDLVNAYIYSARPDHSGRIWIAGSLRYPSYIHHDSLVKIQTHLMEFPQLFGVATDTSNGVWLNTQDQGIIRLINDSVQVLGPAEGIRFTKIQSIVFDKLNNLLVISDYGMLFYHAEKGAVLEFGENSELAYQYPILNSVFTDEEGQIWIGTENGIIKYNCDYLQFIAQNPRVFLSQKNLFYSPIAPGKVRFRHNENNFTFGYTGIWFRNPEGLSYRYMLSGYDLDWNYSKLNQNLTYSQLSAGEYVFRVEVSLDGKNWTGTRDSEYSFEVRPPFWLRWWFILLSGLLLVSAVLLYIRLRLSYLERAKKALEEEVYRRTEEIRNKNEELETQKEEIAAQRDHAEEQRDQIEEQKNEIQASIRYAYRIQSAALPPKQYMDRILKDYFILNKPRDIVSGDFYWVAQKDSHTFFSVGDCTGHGVPGAFMSMLGLSALNDIVKSLDICKASTILDLLRVKIQESLHQAAESEIISNDGMDISLGIYDPTSRMMQFSAAHNPVYLIRKGDITVIPADKTGIGGFLSEKHEFTNHSMLCEPGDQIYLFSDGFPDQFGGSSGKKYKYLRFREFLLTIHKEPMSRQKWLLDEEIENWKSSFDQVDDIMVMGIRIDSPHSKL